MKKLGYLFNADLIRTIAIISVVLIHLSHPLISNPKLIGSFIYWIANLLNSFSRTCIPFFVMLSGFLILGKEESLKASIRRMVLRILIPLTTWTIIYFSWERYGLNTHRSISYIGNRVFEGRIFYLYFLVIMTGLYLLAPLFRKLLKLIKSQKGQNLLISLLIFFGFLILANEQFIIKTFSRNFFTYWLPYVGYFLAGYILGNKDYSKKFSLLFFLWLIGLIITIIMDNISLRLVQQKNYIFSFGTPYFDQHLSPNVILMSLAGFPLLLQKKFSFLEKFQPKIHAFAKASFGIYLIHGIVVDILDKYTNLTVRNFQNNLGLYYIERIFIVFTVSYLITLIISKLPILKSIIGEK